MKVLLLRLREAEKREAKADDEDPSSPATTTKRPSRKIAISGAPLFWCATTS
jgi:hypothetical protein